MAEVIRSREQTLHMYQTILIPLEHSDTDRAILDHVQPLAKLMNSRLILIHVADGFAARNQKELNLAESQEMREDREYLERECAALTAQGFQTTCILACGDPASEIVKAAHQHQCQLIAMATHGHRLVKDMVLGSVASAVRHRTEVPVLLVRSKPA
jgi:nucleotide-binding universal stress UspA family protein